MRGVHALVGLMSIASCAGCRASKYEAPKEPIVIVALEPESALPEGGQFIHVRGSGFDPKSPVKVFFGPHAAPRAAVLSKERIQVETPVAKEGEKHPVRIELPDGRKAVSSTEFRFEHPPDDDGP